MPFGSPLGGGQVQAGGQGERDPGRAVARHRHPDVGAVRHAGEKHTPGKLAIRGDQDQIGSVQRVGRGETSSGDQGK